MIVVADTWIHLRHLGAPQGFVLAGNPDWLDMEVCARISQICWPRWWDVKGGRPRENFLGWFRRLSEFWSASEEYFWSIVERLVRQHQQNLLCAVGNSIGVLDGIAHIGPWNPLPVALKRFLGVSALLQKGTHFMWFLLGMTLHTARTFNSKELTVRNALLAV